MNQVSIARNQNSTGQLRLWQNTAFMIFWVGQSLSALGDAFAVVAVPLLVLQATGSVAQMGFVTATFGAGRLLSGPISGIIVDRVDRRYLMLICDSLRFILYGSIPCVWFLAGPQIWLLYVVVIAGAVSGMCFQVSYVTVIANLVNASHITEANSWLQGALSLTYMVGPLLAGIVSTHFGPSTAIGADAVSFGISAFSLIFIRLRPVSAQSPKGDDRPKGRITELFAGFRFLLHEPVLRWVTFLRAGAAIVLLSGGVSGTLDLFIFRLEHELHLSASTIGLVLGLASIGGILGALVATKLRKLLGFGPCWLGGIALSGVATMGIGAIATTTIIIPLAILFTFGSTLGTIYALSIRQELTSDNLLGRTSAAFSTLVMAFGSAGAVFITHFAQFAGTSASLYLAGSFVVGLAILGCLTPARQRFPRARGDAGVQLK